MTPPSARDRALGDVRPVHGAHPDDVAQEVARGVDHVRTHVGDHPRAAPRPLVPPAVRQTGVELAVVEVRHAPVADLAKMPLLDEAPEIAQRSGEPERERDHVDASRRAVGGVRQCTGLGMGQGERLLAEDVLLGGKRRRRDRSVEIARRADDDGVELGIPDERLPGIVDPGDAPVLGERLGLPGIAGGDRGHLAEVGQEAQARHVNEAGDAARPDQADSDPPPGHCQVPRRLGIAFAVPRRVACRGSERGRG
jgi:hypothetical protein